MKKLSYYIAGALLIGALASCEKEEVTTNEDQEISNSNTKEQIDNGYGGSLAQFTTVGDYLYTIDYKTLNIFYLGDPDNPELSETIDMPIGMETVFHQNGRLFIGANDGVHVYDISEPRSPVEVSDFDHVTSCDPVIANDDYALATLRGGTECGGNLSQLDVLDISNIYNPTLIAEVSLINPYGLGFSAQDQNIVYVCDGYQGLKIYDISNPYNPDEVGSVPYVEAMDVIADGNNLIVLGRQGVFQFDASDPLNLTEKSVISAQ